MHFVILAILTATTLVRSVHTSSHANGECDVIVTSSSQWKCQVNLHGVPPVCEFTPPYVATHRPFITSSLVTKLFGSFRFCVQVPSKQMLDVIMSEYPRGGATCQKGTSGRFSSSFTSNCANRQTFLQLWRENETDSFASFNRKVSQRRTRALKKLSRKKDETNSRKRESNSTAIRIIRKRKSGHRKRPKVFRPPRATPNQGRSSWFLFRQFCARHFASKTRGSPHFDAGHQPLEMFKEKESNGDICLFSLLNNLIVDVRWRPGAEETASEFLFFRFQFNDVDKHGKTSNVSAPVRSRREIGFSVSPEYSRLLITEASHGINPLVLTIVSILILLVCAGIVAWLCCKAHHTSQYVCCCDIYRRELSPIDDRPVETERRRNSWLGLFCCHSEQLVAGSNPASRTPNNNTAHPTACCCCCFKKSCRQVHSASQSTLMTSHSGLTTSRSGSTSFGASPHVSARSCIGANFNNPYSYSLPYGANLALASSSVPAQKIPVAPHPDWKSQQRNTTHSNCIRAPPNRTHANLDSALVCSESGHVTSHVIRNPRDFKSHNSLASTVAEHPHVNIESDVLLPPPCDHNLIQSGAIFDDPPPEYSEPPVYDSVV